MMRLIVHERHSKADAFIAVAAGDDFVALCAVSASDEQGARAALKALCALGVFPIASRRLKYCVRVMTNPTCADVYDGVTGIYCPPSRAGTHFLCNIVAADREIVVDSEAALKAIESAFSPQQVGGEAPSCTGTGCDDFNKDVSIRVATMGAVDVWNNSMQNHCVFMNADDNNKILAAGNVTYMLRLAKQACATGCRNMIVLFGSTVGSGLVRAATTAPADSPAAVVAPQPPTVNSFVYVSPTSLGSHLTMLVGSWMLQPAAVARTAKRALVAAEECLVPLVVPAGDEGLSAQVYSLLKVGTAAVRTMGTLSGNGDVAKTPTLALAAIEKARALLAAAPEKDTGGSLALLDLTAVPAGAGAPAGILRLVHSTAKALPNPSHKKGGGGASFVSLGDLKRPKVVANGVTYIVDTPLDYYHYKCDGFGDDGWGCAYRSLQLVLSWFQHKGLVKEAPMPSIREIQTILSEVDPAKAVEKQKGFVGSSEWIGSFEVMLVLQRYVEGLECTITRLESGDELSSNPSIHRQLATHFEKGGAPVMIGGSSFAHTIVGIDVNIRTSEVQYLVADPHYASSTPDASTVIAKGWVGWKDAAKFFNSKSWYNMCLPRSYSL